MAKISASELLRLACVYAEQDRESFIVSYSHMPDDPACQEAMAYLKQLKAYRLKRWGKGVLESELEKAKPVDFREVAKRKH